MLSNELLDDAFAVGKHDHEIWVCVVEDRPPVRNNSSSPQGLQLHPTYKRYARARRR